MNMNYQELVKKIEQFNNERDWDKFHNIKDLATAINIESSELQELLLWKKNEELSQVLTEKRDKIESEVADIFTYLIIFCYKADINLEKAVLKKLVHNAKKYPVHKVKGRNNKYDEY